MQPWVTCLVSGKKYLKYCLPRWGAYAYAYAGLNAERKPLMPHSD